MKRTTDNLKLAVLTLTAIILLPISALSSRSGTVEVGFDGTLSVTGFNSPSISPPSIIKLSIPSRVRFGTFSGEEQEAELMLNFLTTHQGDVNLTALDTQFGISFHPQGKSQGSISFIEPLVGFRFVSFRSSSDIQLLVGLESGIKLISTSGLATRLSGFVNHAFETNRSLGSTTFGVNFGMSFFIKKTTNLDPY